MIDPRWPAVRRIVEQALDLPPEERAASVRSACAEDPQLAAAADAIAALLARDDVATDQLLARGLGARIGPYRLLALLGVGGAGAVYRAQRNDRPDAPVALKLLAANGAGSGRAAPDVRSFRRERTLLARLAHPAIPRLLDAGIADDGTPWLALELVDGEPIDRHCDARRLPLRARLGLFAAVCAGVQHAHEQRVIHRDLKPQNLLVTPAGEPRLLDFGIARLLQGDRARTLVPFLTPQYASPEQFRGGAAQVANDVYALGAILFELAAGVRPYHVGGLPLALAARIVAAGAARPPSVAFARLAAREPARASAIAADRSTTSAVLEHELAGGLDAVIARAIDPDPLRRHRSAAALQRDLERLLAGRRPGWPAPRPLRALVARPRRFVAALALLAATGGAVELVVAARPDATAAAAAPSAARAGAALTRSLDVTSRLRPGEAFVTLEWLESTARDLEPLAEEEPALVGAGLAQIGEQCRALRMPHLAVGHFERAAECFRAAGAESGGRRVSALADVALTRADLRRVDATAAADAALAEARELEPDGGPLTARSLFARAVALARAARTGSDRSAATTALDEAAAAFARGGGDGAPERLRCLHEQARLLLHDGRPAAAEARTRHALERSSARGDERGEPLCERVALLRTLADCLAAQGRGRDAETALLQALSLTRTRIDDASTPPILLELAELERAAGELRLAEIYAQRALALHALRATAGNAGLAGRCAPAIAALTNGSGRAARPACAQLRDALARRSDGSVNRFELAETLACLGRIWSDDGELELARRFLASAAGQFERCFGADDPQAVAARAALAAIPEAVLSSR